jgi:hypothetical protein
LVLVVLVALVIQMQLHHKTALHLQLLVGQALRHSHLLVFHLLGAALAGLVAEIRQDATAGLVAVAGGLVLAAREIRHQHHQMVVMERQRWRIKGLTGLLGLHHQTVLEAVAVEPVELVALVAPMVAMADWRKSQQLPELLSIMQAAAVVVAMQEPLA